jgi:small-conductance mechanosensitive channel
VKDERDEVKEVSNEVKDQLANIDLSIRDWARRWKNKSAGNPNDMKAPQKIEDLKAQKAALMKKHNISEDFGEKFYNKIRKQAVENVSGAIATVATPMGKMKRRKDSIFASKESKDLKEV